MTRKTTKVVQSGSSAQNQVDTLARPNSQTAFPISTPAVATASTTEHAGDDRLPIRANARNSRRAAKGNKKKVRFPSTLCIWHALVVGVPSASTWKSGMASFRRPTTSRIKAATR